MSCTAILARASGRHRERYSQALPHGTPPGSARCSGDSHGPWLDTGPAPHAAVLYKARKSMWKAERRGLDGEQSRRGCVFLRLYKYPRPHLQVSMFLPGIVYLPDDCAICSCHGLHGPRSQCLQGASSRGAPHPGGHRALDPEINTDVKTSQPGRPVGSLLPSRSLGSLPPAGDSGAAGHRLAAGPHQPPTPPPLRPGQETELLGAPAGKAASLWKAGS